MKFVPFAILSLLAAFPALAQYPTGIVTHQDPSEAKPTDLACITYAPPKDLREYVIKKTWQVCIDRQLFNEGQDFYGYPDPSKAKNSVERVALEKAFLRKWAADDLAQAKDARKLALSTSEFAAAVNRELAESEKDVDAQKNAIPRHLEHKEGGYRVVGSRLHTGESSKAAREKCEAKAARKRKKDPYRPELCYVFDEKIDPEKPHHYMVLHDLALMQHLNERLVHLDLTGQVRSITYGGGIYKQFYGDQEVFGSVDDETRNKVLKKSEEDLNEEQEQNRMSVFHQEDRARSLTHNAKDMLTAAQNAE